MGRRAEIRARLEAITADRRAIHAEAGDAELTEAQQSAWDALDTEETALRTEDGVLEAAEERAARVRESRERWGTTQVAPSTTREYALSPGTARAETAGLIQRANEGRCAQVSNLAPALRSVYEQNFQTLVRRHSGDYEWARNILARSHPDYASAFSKLMTGQGMFLTEQEKRAAIAVGTNTQGGYLVPTHLDPTLIITNVGTSGTIRPISSVKTITQGNIWHGVQAGASTASWDAELTEVSDDTPAVATASVTLFSGKSLIQAGIEAFEDISNLAEDATMILLDNKERLDESAFATGGGTTAPRGIFTALNATTGRQQISATAATIAAADLNATFLKVGARWRKRSIWLANAVYTGAIKSLGTAVAYNYSGDLRDPFPEKILGRPVVDSDDAPTTQTTTALDNEVIFGDFSNFVILDKPGSTAIEFIPHLFNTTTNLPDGRRAWYMHFRTGSNSVNDAAFALLVDKTSA